MATTLPPGPPPSPAFDFAQGFRFTFEDPEWIKKMLWGGAGTVAALLLIGLPLVTGYVMRLTRNTARGEPRPLPSWDDFGGIFAEGIPGAIVGFVYVAVLIVVPIGGLFAVVAMVGGVSALGDSDAASAIAGVLGVMGMLLFYALLFIAVIVMCVILPAAVTRVAMTGRMGAGFELGEVWSFIRRNPGNYALALVLYLLANLISQFGWVLCCIGIFPVTFWSYCVLGWGMGEVVRLDQGAAA